MLPTTVPEMPVLPESVITQALPTQVMSMSCGLVQVPQGPVQEHAASDNVYVPLRSAQAPVNPVTVTVIGLQSVGLLLVVALLIVPPAAARFWSDRLPGMTLASALIGGLAALGGVVTSALIPRLAEVKFGEDDTHKDLDGSVHPIRHVTAQVPDDLFPAPSDAPPPAPGDPVRMIELDFGIDTETGALWTLGVTALGRDDLVPLELRFELHGPTRSGLLVPGNVKVYQAGRSDEVISLGVDVDEDGLLILEVGTDIDEAIFTVPDDEA